MYVRGPFTCHKQLSQQHFKKTISQCCLMLSRTSKNKLTCCTVVPLSDPILILRSHYSLSHKRLSSILLLAALHCCLELIPLGLPLPPCACTFLTSPFPFLLCPDASPNPQKLSRRRRILGQVANTYM